MKTVLLTIAVIALIVIATPFLYVYSYYVFSVFECFPGTYVEYKPVFFDTVARTPQDAFIIDESKLSAESIERLKVYLDNITPKTEYKVVGDKVLIKCELWKDKDAMTNVTTKSGAWDRTPVKKRGTVDGEALFKAVCAMCHGVDGQGGPMGVKFQRNAFIKRGSEAEIADVIKYGRADAAKKYKDIIMPMPGFTLNENEVEAVIAHIKGIAAK